MNYGPREFPTIGLGLPGLPTKNKIKNPTNNIPYVRNVDWPSNDLPTTEKFSGLFAVYDNGSNFVAISVAGNYTINWGDGSGDINVSSGVTSYRNISYSDVSSNPVGTSNAVACTFTDSGDTVNLTAHGWQNGQIVNFASITSTTGISTFTKYYIVNKATDTFQVSTTIGGTALTLTTDGSGTVFVPLYKIAVVTIVPNGGNLTTIDLQKEHNQSGLNTSYEVNWLDIAINGTSNLTTLYMGWNIATATQYITLRKLVEVKLGDNGVTNFSYLLYNCYSLASVPFLNTTAGTNFTNMFYSCYSLTSVPLLNTAAGTNFTGMFNSCYSLTSVPLLNTAAGTTFTNMFVNCYSLTSVPLLNTAAGTDLSNMFYGCYSLITIPLLNTGANLTFSGTFYNCYSLPSIPLLNTASCTNFTNMFNSCYSLTSVPLLNTAAGTAFGGMFQNCDSLTSVPLLNTASGTVFASMFYACNILTTIPLLNTAAGTDFTSMFQNCYYLASIPLLNTAAGTNFSNMFYSCFSLTSVPLLNTAAGTNFTGMFGSCSCLATIPLLNTAAGTNFSSMFQNCASLTYVPLLNTAAGTNFGAMFTACYSLGLSTLKGTTKSINYSNCALSSTALDEIYANLGSATSQTITVTGNYGTTGDTPSIATAKGWTVTG